MRWEEWVSDDLWRLVEPLLPPEKPPKSPGRPRVPNKVCLAAIMFVLKTGAQWKAVPKEWGLDGTTAWRRFVAWRESGVWDKVFMRSLSELQRQGRIHWTEAMLDASMVPAPRGALTRGQTRRIAESLARSATL